MDMCRQAGEDGMAEETGFDEFRRAFPAEGGHRRVSGLVRASLKREARRLILQQIEDDDQQ